MDFVTHASVGAIVGLALGHAPVAPSDGPAGGRPPGGAGPPLDALPSDPGRVARGAMALGALTALLPDADHFLELASAEAYFVHHRTLTHSLLFAGALVGLAGSSLGGRLLGRLGIGSGARRAAIVGGSLASHLLLDLLTPFGTMLLYPLEGTLYSLDALPIVAPFMMVLSVAGLVLVTRALRRGRDGERRAAWASLLALSAFCTLEYAVARRGEAHALAEVRPGAAPHVVRLPAGIGDERLPVELVPPAPARRVLLSVPQPGNPLAADVFVRDDGDVRRLSISPGGAVEETLARPRIQGPLFAESAATPRGALVEGLEARTPVSSWLSRLRVPVASVDAGNAVIWDDLQFVAFSPPGHWPLRLRATPVPSDPRSAGAESAAAPGEVQLAVEENPRGPQVVLYLGVVLAVVLLARRAGALSGPVPSSPPLRSVPSAPSSTSSTSSTSSPSPPSPAPPTPPAPSP